jgi:hypothetical protein
MQAKAKRTLLWKKETYWAGQDREGIARSFLLTFASSSHIIGGWNWEAW